LAILVANIVGIERVGVRRGDTRDSPFYLINLT